MGIMDAIFIARMEQILHLYRLPYDPFYPLLCFDERPCFLIGEAVAGLEMKAGQVARQHYAYKKNGSCVLLMALEALTGKRLAEVHKQRTKPVDFHSCQTLPHRGRHSGRYRRPKRNHRGAQMQEGCRLHGSVASE